MKSGKLFTLVTLFSLVNLVLHASAKKGVLYPHITLKPPLIIDSAGYRTTYACEGKVLHIICDHGIIHLIRANYGRFSISICNDHGNLDWRVNCMSHHSFLIMQERCSMKPNCSVNVSSTTFQDPCPGTLKYLEVQYHCGTEAPLLPIPSTSQSPLIKAVLTNGTGSHHNRSKMQTVTYRAMSSSVLPTMPTVQLRKTSTSFPISTSVSGILQNRTEPSYESSTTLKPVSALSTKGPFTSLQTSTVDSPLYSPDHYCPPVVVRSISWPWTKAGETAMAKCPDGSSGTARWFCKVNPVEWSSEEPDLLHCHSLWLENVKERIENGDSIISVTSELAAMASAKPLFSEDLKIIGELIQQALYESVNKRENFLDTWHRYNVLREFLESSVQALSNLLDDKQDSAWNDLPLPERKTVVSSLLHVLDESALLLAETSSEDGSFSLVKSNVLLSLQVFKSKSLKYLHFPITEEISPEHESIHWLSMQDSLILPQQSVEDYSKNGFCKVVFIAFNKLNNFLRPSNSISHYSHDNFAENVSRIINSKIIGASLDRSGNAKLYQPVVITLKHLIEENVTNPVCVYWDYHLRDWSAQGCWVESSNRTHTVCLCDHLTNFAVIMDLQTDVETVVDVHFLYFIISAGCIIAIITLLVTVIILFTLSLDLSEDSTFIHRNMFLCLLLSELVFLGGIKQTKYFLACAIVAGLLQYLFLVTFSWMFFECYHQYVMLIRSCDAKKGNAYWYYAAAYTIPGVITGISASVDPSSYGTKNYCWLQTDNYFVFSFVGPAVSIIFGGVVFLCISLCMFSHNMAVTSEIKGKDNANLINYRCWNRRSIFLVVLLSVTWTSGLLFINEESISLAYVFSVLNGLQGIAVLVLYCFRNEKVKQDLKKLFRTDICFKQKKDPEPQCSRQAAFSGSTPSETLSSSQESRNRSRDKTATLVKNIRADSSAVPGSPVTEPNEDLRQQNVLWMVRGNAHWKPTYYSDRNDIEEHSVTLPRGYQSSDQVDQRHHILVSPESNGQFLDHIYETIDDETLSIDGKGKKPLDSCQRFPPPENYYGDHSDLSQHSSSSYGYDQQPLLIVGGQNRNSLQNSFPVSKDSAHLHVDEINMWEQSQNQTYNKDKSPTDISVALKIACDQNSAGSVSQKQAFQQKSSSDSWEHPLPDLLQSPPDSAVVLAVLDGDKVVSRIQQDDVVVQQPQYKLSTYC